MFLVNSFRYYKKIYGNSKNQFDRDLKQIFFVFYYSLLGICKFGLGAVLERIIEKKFKSVVKNNIVGFTFTEYDFNLAKTLHQLGLDFQCISFGKINSDTKNTVNVSHFIIFLASLANAKHTILELTEAKNDPTVFSNKIRIIKLCGLIYLYKLFLKKGSVLINFNDHSIYDVCSFDYADNLNICSVYIQHAPVGYHFPPLYHNLNILFSNDSLEKYQKINKDVEIFLLFDIRFYNAIEKIVSNVNIRNVLRCINEIDNFDNVIKTAKQIKALGYSVTIRPHPRDKGKYKKIDGCIISECGSIWDDLNNVDIVLANETGVVLEAIFAKKLVYKCAFFSTSFDNYSFLAKGILLKEYYNIEELIFDMKLKKVEYNDKLLPYFIGDFENITQKIEKLNTKLSLMPYINAKGDN